MRQEKYQDDHELKLDLLFVCVINGKDIILVFMQLTYYQYDDVYHQTAFENSIEMLSDVNLLTYKSFLQI